MKVGIGIVTYNRPWCLKQIVEGIQKHTTGTYDLFISDDGSTDGETLPWIAQSGIPFETGSNKGVVYSKNRILTRFRDYDYIFIVEDDLCIFGDGWNELYIKAIEESGNQHFNFIPFEIIPDPTKEMASKIVAVGISEYPSCTVASCSRLSGVMMVVTQKVLQTVGGLDFRFRGYGYGHCEYTERIHKAGLTEFRYAAIVESKDFLKLLPEPHLLEKGQMHQQLMINLDIARECIRDQNLYRPFDINDPGYLADRVLKQ